MLNAGAYPNDPPSPPRPADPPAGDCAGVKGGYHRALVPTLHPADPGEATQAGQIAAAFASATVLLAYALCRVRLVDDGFAYQAVAQSPLLQGRLDLAPTGFHGVSILAAPLFALTRSAHAVAWLGVILSAANPWLMRAAARRTVGERAAVVAPLLYLLLPGVIWEPIKGHVNSVFAFFILLTVWLAARGSCAAPLAWGYAIVVKPFAAALAPLWVSRRVRGRRELAMLVSGLAIPIVYVAATWAQTGSPATAYSGAAGAPGIAQSLSCAIHRNIARIALNLFVAGDWNAPEGYGTVRAIAPPSLLVLGAWTLWKLRRDAWPKRAAAAVLLNLLMVAAMNHLFAKYLLPAVLLASLAAAAMIVDLPWLGLVVTIDAFQFAYLRAKLAPPDTIAGLPGFLPVLLPWAAAAAAFGWLWFKQAKAEDASGSPV